MFQKIYIKDNRVCYLPHYFNMVEVGGSNPPGPTKSINLLYRHDIIKGFR